MYLTETTCNVTCTVWLLGHLSHGSLCENSGGRGGNVNHSRGDYMGAPASLPATTLPGYRLPTPTQPKPPANLQLRRLQGTTGNAAPQRTKFYTPMMVERTTVFSLQDGRLLPSTCCAPQPLPSQPHHFFHYTHFQLTIDST